MSADKCFVDVEEECLLFKAKVQQSCDKSVTVGRQGTTTPKKLVAGRNSNRTIISLIPRIFS
jgi:hypothetical protein